MTSFPQWIRKSIRKGGALVFGQKPRIHSIRFGPLKGRKIYIRFDFSPRMFFGVDEPSIAKWSEEFVAPGDVIYDIGAHIGYTCLLFAQQLENSGSVHAFEILPSIAEGYLKQTIDANSFTNITIHNIGLSANTQILELPIGETGMTSIYSDRTNAQEFEMCRTISLDEYVLQKELPLPSLVKIDIEGAEVECLLGGKEVISKCLPRMIIEFHSLDLLKQGFSFLDPFGYRIYLPNGDKLDHSMLVGMKRFHESTLCLPDKL